MLGAPGAEREGGEGGACCFDRCGGRRVRGGLPAAAADVRGGERWVLPTAATDVGGGERAARTAASTDVGGGERWV